MLTQTEKARDNRIAAREHVQRAHEFDQLTQFQ
jgi:hypothetical protein